MQLIGWIVIGGIIGLGWWIVGKKFRKHSITPDLSSLWKNIVFGALLGLFGSTIYGYTGIGADTTEDAKFIKTLSSTNWEREVLQSKKPVLVDFWAPWCGPCRMQGPIVAKVAREEAGVAIVGKVNADDYPELLQRYGVQGIPTLMVFQSGKPVETFVGLTDGNQLKAAIEAPMGQPRVGNSYLWDERG